MYDMYIPQQLIQTRLIRRTQIKAKIIPVIPYHPIPPSGFVRRLILR